MEFYLATYKNKYWFGISSVMEIVMSTKVSLTERFSIRK